jgi:hypothetical protein
MMWPGSDEPPTQLVVCYNSTHKFHGEGRFSHVVNTLFRCCLRYTRVLYTIYVAYAWIDFRDLLQPNGNLMHTSFFPKRRI